jgi:hypothetical protein
MITLWRIQRRDNRERGVFTCGDAIGRASMAGFCAWEHPEPSEEGHTMHCGTHFCAFASLDQFKHWFRTPDQRKAVLTHPELEFVKLQVNTAVLLKKQAIFKWDDVVSITAEEFVECA